jgi:DNA-directed RNA polymerase subunit RPC12/RpoP
MPKAKKKTEFQKIVGVKKVIRCVICGKRVVVQNFNQLKCEKCGYRNSKTAETA